MLFRLTREKLGNKKALLGFGGTPLTLASYMVEGESSSIAVIFWFAFKAPLLSTKSKLKFLNEPFISAYKGSDDDLWHFVTRRLGKEFLDYATHLERPKENLLSFDHYGSGSQG